MTYFQSMLEILKSQCYRVYNMRILLCFFFFFLAMLSNCLIIPVAREKIKVKLALAIPTGVPTILAEEMIQTPLVALKTNKVLSM